MHFWIDLSSKCWQDRHPTAGKVRLHWSIILKSTITLNLLYIYMCVYIYIHTYMLGLISKWPSVFHSKCLFALSKRISEGWKILVWTYSCFVFPSRLVKQSSFKKYVIFSRHCWERKFLKPQSRYWEQIVPATV